MTILLVFIIAALLLWLALTNRLQSFLDAMGNPTGVKK